MKIILAVILINLLLLYCRTASNTSPEKNSKIKQATTTWNIDSVNQNCSSATGCHSNIHPIDFDNWVINSQEMLKCLEDNTGEDRVNCLVYGGNFDGTNFKDSSIGIMRALVDSEYFQQYFTGTSMEDKYNLFKIKAKMPPEDESAENFVSADQVDSFIDWIKNYDPQGNVNLSSNHCEDHTPEWMKEHIRSINSNSTKASWLYKFPKLGNHEMYGCPEHPRGDSFDPFTYPFQCFQTETVDADKIDDGWVLATTQFADSANANVFPWRAPAHKLNLGETLREIPYRVVVLKKFKYHKSWWMRSSPDGRLVGQGDGYILDMQTDNYYVVPAAYDPQFSFDNTMFSYMGVNGFDHGGSGSFCHNNMLFNGKQKLDGICADQGGSGTASFQSSSVSCSATGQDKLYNLRFTDFMSYCDTEAAVGTYQHIGIPPVAGDPYIVVRGGYNADNLSGSDGLKDFVSNSLEVFTFNQSGSGEDATITSESAMNFSFDGEGDFSINPMGDMLLSRFYKPEQTEPGVSNFGYLVRPIFERTSDGSISFPDPRGSDAKEPARVCLYGTKPSMSAGSRFLVTHHYVVGDDQRAAAEEELIEICNSFTDNSSDDSFVNWCRQNSDATPQTLQYKGSSNIYVADLLTNRKIRVTLMPSGVLAAFPHVRADNWIYFKVYDKNTQTAYVAATDILLHLSRLDPIE